jgi:hypothetical protein
MCVGYKTEVIVSCPESLPFYSAFYDGMAVAHLGFLSQTGLSWAKLSFCAISHRPSANMPPPKQQARGHKA